LGELEARLRERLGDRVSFGERVPFADIEGVGESTVEGHSGTVLVGDVGPGGARPWPLALVLGRRHLYEGGRLGTPALIRWLAARGIRQLVAVSAAGAVNKSIRPGQLVAIKEIIDMQNRGCLQPHLRRSRRGALADRALGAGQPRLSQLLLRELEAAAGRAHVALARGTLACGVGPAYETPAEVRLLQKAGVDVATMSAAPEVQFATDAGMEVALVAAVTNLGTGISPEPLDHGGVLAVAASMSGPLGAILAEVATGA
jgi:purine-nucleoside phosphorylase